MSLCLACGRIATDADRDGLRKHFAEKSWELWDEGWLRDKLASMAAGGLRIRFLPSWRAMLRGKVQ